MALVSSPVPPEEAPPVLAVQPEPDQAAAAMGKVAHAPTVDVSEVPVEAAHEIAVVLTAGAAALGPKAALPSAATLSQDDVAAPDAPSPAVKKTSKSSKRSNVPSKFMAPTRASLARMAGKAVACDLPPPRSQILRESMIASVMAAPSGQRTTKPAAFSAHAQARARPAKGPLVDSEQAAFDEARKHAFKPIPLPKHIIDAAPPLEGFAVAHSQPKKPQDVITPFNLASTARHEAMQAKLRAKVDTQRAAADAARVFKATDKRKVAGVLTKVHTPAKPAARPATSPAQAPANAERRVAHHRMVLAPRERARMPAEERAKLEAREGAAAESEAAAKAEAARARAERAHDAELERMDVSALRASMTFKARKLPSFDAPFVPVVEGKATTPDAFAFATDGRLGHPVSARDRTDAAAPMQSPGGFAGSLRASSSLRRGGLCTSHSLAL